MPNLTVFRLTFQSGLHVGTRGVNLEETGVCIPSDTLFAALVDAFRRTGGNADEFGAPFVEPGPSHQATSVSSQAPYVAGAPFLLTSVFPFAGAVRFFPMPVGLQRFFQDDTLSTRRKDLNRIRFVSESLFRRMMAGEMLDAWLFPEKEQVEPDTGVAIQGRIFWLTLDECNRIPTAFRRDRKTKKAIPRRALRYRKIFAGAQVPRVTVDRVTSASEIFHTGRVTFARGCGLWFGIAWRKPQAMVDEKGLTYGAALNRVLTMLGDEGIGGERSVGYGSFSYEEEESPLALDDPEPGDLILLLSRYHPQQVELPAALSGDGTAYALTAVGGWLRTWDGASERRRRLWLVNEGSIVKAVSAGILGDVADLRPTYEQADKAFPHPVWRYGLGLGAALREVSRG